MIGREFFQLDSGLRTKTRLHTKFHRSRLSSLEELAVTDTHTNIGPPFALRRPAEIYI